MRFTHRLQGGLQETRAGCYRALGVRYQRNRHRESSGLTAPNMGNDFARTALNRERILLEWATRGGSIEEAHA